MCCLGADADLTARLRSLCYSTRISPRRLEMTAVLLGRVTGANVGAWAAARYLVFAWHCKCYDASRPCIAHVPMAARVGPRSRPGDCSPPEGVCEVRPQGRRELVDMLHHPHLFTSATSAFPPSPGWPDMASSRGQVPPLG